MIHYVQAQTPAEVEGQGVVVGCYETKDGYCLSHCGKSVDSECDGKLQELVVRSGKDCIFSYECCSIFSVFRMGGQN